MNEDAELKAQNQFAWKLGRSILSSQCSMWRYKTVWLSSCECFNEVYL